MSHRIVSGIDPNSTPPRPCPVLAAWVMRVGFPANVGPGTRVLVQGEPADRIVYVDRGVVRLQRAERTGLEMSLAIRRSGSLVGLAAALGGAPEPATAVLRTAGRIVIIRAADVQAALSCTTIGPRLVTALASEAIALIEWCSALRAGSVRERVIAVLRELAAEPASLPCRIEVTAGEMASLAACDASHAARILRALRDEGLIALQRRCIVVHKPIWNR